MSREGEADPQRQGWPLRRAIQRLPPWSKTGVPKATATGPVPQRPPPCVADLRVSCMAGRIGGTETLRESKAEPHAKPHTVLGAQGEPASSVFCLNKQLQVHGQEGQRAWGQQRDTTPRVFSIPRRKEFPCGGLWASLGWPHIILSPLKDLGALGRLRGGEEILKEGAKGQSVSEPRARCGMHPVIVAIKIMMPAERGICCLPGPMPSVLHGLAHDIGLWFSTLRQFPQRVQLMRMGKQRPLMEEVGRCPKSSHGGALLPAQMLK